MKRILTFGVSILVAVLVGSIFAGQALGQKNTEARARKTGTSIQAPESPSALFVEDFNYTAGDLITAHGWTAHSGAGTNPITVTAPGLTYSGYASSGIGNAVSMTTSGEDDNKTYATISSGSVYAAFMVNITGASLDPLNSGYFFHLGPDPISTTFRGRVFIKRDASNNIAFGISKAAVAATDIAYTGFNYSLNTTYLVVVKYTIVAGATNDTVSLFVNPALTAIEPAPLATAPDVGAGDINPGSVALRQGVSTTNPTVRVDGIRVGATWAGISNNPPFDAPADFNGDGKTDYSVTRITSGAGGHQVRWFHLFNGTGGTYEADWGLDSDAITPGDFDGDGKDDIAIWRDAGNNSAFYIFQSSNGTFRLVPFGLTNDYPYMIADYDGDGKDDPAIYRAGAATDSTNYQSYIWWYGSSGVTANQQVVVAWGVGPDQISGDIPVPGDFNGDGKADYCVFRDTGDIDHHAVFLVHPGTGGYDAPGADTATLFGLASDLVVPGDYDGDGKTDFAVTRNNNGSLDWYYLPSSGGPVVYRQWGRAASGEFDYQVQGDYDGDGRTDMAIWRYAGPNAPAFWVLGSQGAITVQPFGLASDTPTAYDVH